MVVRSCWSSSYSRSSEEALLIQNSRFLRNQEELSAEEELTPAALAATFPEIAAAGNSGLL